MSGATEDLCVLCHSAVLQGDAARLTDLLRSAEAGQNKADPALSRSALVDARVHTTNNGVLTLLMVAAMNRKETCVGALIEAGADVNKATQEGWTALMFGVRAKATRTVRRLLGAGANPIAITLDHRTPLGIARSLFQKPIIQLLQVHIRLGEQLLTSSKKQDVDGMFAALKGGAWVDYAGSPGMGFLSDHNTALHRTCKRGHIPGIQLLLQHKASVTVVNTKGQTPADVASCASIRALVSKMPSRTRRTLAALDTTPESKHVRAQPQVAEEEEEHTAKDAAAVEEEKKKNEHATALYPEDIEEATHEEVMSNTEIASDLNRTSFSTMQSMQEMCAKSPSLSALKSPDLSALGSPLSLDPWAQLENDA